MTIRITIMIITIVNNKNNSINDNKDEINNNNNNYKVMIEDINNIERDREGGGYFRVCKYALENLTG